MERIPSRTEMQKWTLLAIHRMDGNGSNDEIDKQVNNMLLMLGLPKEVADERHSDNRQTRLDNLVAWARSQLKNEKKLLDNPRRSFWRINRAGKAKAPDFFADELAQISAKEIEIEEAERKQARKDERAVKRAVKSLAEKAGVEVGAVNLLRQHDISQEELESFLEWRSSNPQLPDLDQSGKTIRVSSQEARNESEKQAIAHVMKKENHLGWEEMESNNPGFDLRRIDDTGEPIWCEVKGIRGSFERSRSVLVTPTEFLEAQKRGNRYWLYVVENVDKPQYRRIIKIRNPVGNVGRYTFGGSWREVAEKDE